MSKTSKQKIRFGKLQKWILIKLYLSIKPQWSDGCLFRRTIVKGYYGFTNPKAEVIVSHTIWNLQENKYIQGYCSGQNTAKGKYHPAPDSRDERKEFIEQPMLGINIKLLILTEKGKQKARELLKVNK